MSTGRKTLRENTRERVISSDFNRAQVFGQSDANDILATQVIQPVDDTVYAGTTFPPGTAPPLTLAVFRDTVTAPAYGTILEGLMVIVPAAAASIIVTPGLALIVDPDGQPGSTTPTPPNPDDSVTKLVRGSGVPLGALPWTPNGVGGIRVDVVEIQRSDTVVETDNRDIFNPSTGLFTAQSVVKVTEGEVSYRIRLGVSGGGLPAPALGWLPIAILATPVGAADLDAVEVWDVRNLATDYATPGVVRLDSYPLTEHEQTLIDTSVLGTLRLSGLCVRSVLSQRFGGALFDLDTLGTIDLLDPKYQEPGFAPVASLPYYVYSILPLGYLRWVRYYKTPIPTVGGRTPGPFRGFPVLTQVPALNGIPTAPVAIPTPWGIAGFGVGVLIATGVVDTLAVLMGSVNDGDMTRLKWFPFAAPWQTVVGVVVGLTASWPLLPGISYPAGSRRIRVFVGLTFPAVGVPGDSFLANTTFSLRNPGTGGEYATLDSTSGSIIQPALGAPFIGLSFDVPVGADGASVPVAPPVLSVTVGVVAGSVPVPVTLLGAVMSVIGWD